MIASSAELVSARISRQAVAAQDNVAIVDGAGSLTYASLDNQSDILAERLKRAGVVRGQTVGILMERSRGFVVATLAVLKSDAAYVPVDPSSPTNRLFSVLSSANVVAVLADQQNIGRLVSGPWQLIDADVGDDYSTRTVSAPDIQPTDLAYIIYTSGSTGTPKGVEITHANLCNLIDWHQTTFRITASDRASQVAGVGFDAAVWEIWPHLASGASVHIADDITRWSAEALRDWLVSEEISIAYVPTALAEQLIRMTWPANTGLRLLLTGGDTLRRRPLAALTFSVINNYGPTECTVVATSGEVAPDGDGLPSIGRPINTARAFILDDELHTVAYGEAGELCLAGALVGKGYRNQPELTADRFVTTTVAAGESLRLYRTGDRCRFLENGEVEFLGRLDSQVKIRGHRIELGEITNALSRHDEVSACVVAVKDIGNSGPTLVAYVVPADDNRLTASALQEFLAADLPSYMIPGFFVRISHLPLQSSGKPDYSSLPTPDSGNMLASSDGSSGSLSTHAAQQRLASMIASMLGRAAINPDDNFFMVGGHSMLGVELVAKIRDTFGVRLTLRQLFQAPTVSALTTEVLRQIKQ